MFSDSIHRGLVQSMSFSDRMLAEAIVADLERAGIDMERTKRQIEALKQNERIR